MADRYWVGGTGTWNTTNTANWSTGSGGGGGASVPTAADSVFFDQAGTYTVTMTGALACLDLTVSAGTVTFATGTNPTLAVSGSFTLLAGGTWSSTGAITFNATTTGKTITTNGVSIAANITLNGVGGAWTLGSALTASGSRTLTLTNGTFDTGNFNVTYSTFSSSNSNTRTITLGSSTLTLSSSTPIVFTTSTNLTLNANTSTITASSSTGGTFDGGGKTFYNVSFTGTTGGWTITGANTYNNLSFPARSTLGISTNFIDANSTINGTLTVSGGTATNRSLVRDNGTVVPVTLTCAAVSLTDVDFINVTLAGAAANSSGTRLGNGGGNSGITFDTPKTVYWNLAAGTLWTNTGWATASGGGTPAVNNFPLAQDTAVFEATGLNSGSTITIAAGYLIGTVDMSARTANTMNLQINQQTKIYGDMICGTGSNCTGTNTLTWAFVGSGTQKLTCAGNTWTVGFIVSASTSTLVLQDAFSSSTTATTTLSIGTLNANGFNVTLSAGTFNSSNSNTRTLTLGSGTWTIGGSGGSAWNCGTTTNLTVTASTGTIKMTSASAKSFLGGGKSWPTLDQGGAGTLTLTGSNTFVGISNTYSATGATAITFPSGGTQTVTNFTATGASGKVLTITSSSAGTAATLSKSSGTVSVDYMSIKDSTATGGASWYAGANSTSVSGNSGWIFTAPPAPSAVGGQFMAFF